MSKQLAISAAFSTFAMAACALFATPGPGMIGRDSNAGAPNKLEAPANRRAAGSPGARLVRLISRQTF